MNTCTRRESGTALRLGLLAGLGLAAVWLAGCASSGYNKSNAAADSLQRAVADVRTQSRELELTLGILKGMAGQPDGDLKPPFHHFSVALDRLAASTKRLEAAGKRFEQKHAVYFQEWDRQLAAMDYEHIRDLSLARKSEVTNRFVLLQQRYQQCQQVVQPLISYLLDIRKALSADLTPRGIEALQGVIQNADANAGKVRVALDALASELASSSTRLSSVALQEPPVSNQPPVTRPTVRKVQGPAPPAEPAN